MKRDKIGLSIDITNRCTLNCKTCYMRWYDPKEDLPLDAWEALIEDIPEHERLLCAWTGGEPFLRIDDLKRLAGFFKWNWVATNGTLQLERIPKTTILVSIDGTAKVHNEVRGRWQDIVDNVISDCYIVYDITHVNSSREILEETILFWKDRVKGIIYSFYTPRIGDGGTLYQGPEERLEVVGRIKDLREIHGDFIVNPIGQLYSSVRPDGDCPAARTLVALDSQGNVKKPCVLGEEVDCSVCGCAVPSFMKLHPSIISAGIRVLGGFKNE